MIATPAGTKGIPLGIEKYGLYESDQPGAQFVKRLYNGNTFWDPDDNASLIEIGLIINRQCNSDCPYCYYPESENDSDGSEKDGLIKRLKWLKEVNPGLKTIAVIGRESFLDFELLKSLAISVGGNGIKFGFITNGLLLNKYSEALQKIPFDYIDISLHMFLNDQSEKNLLREIQHTDEHFGERCEINCGLILLRDNHPWLKRSMQKLYRIGIRNFFVNLYADARSRSDFLPDYVSFLKGIDLLREFCTVNRDVKMVVDIWGEKVPFFPALFENEDIAKDRLFVDEYLVCAPVSRDLHNLNYRFLMNMPWFATLDDKGYLYSNPDDAINQMVERATYKIETSADVCSAMKKLHSADNPLYQKIASALRSECRDRTCFPFCLGSNKYCGKGGRTFH